MAKKHSHYFKPVNGLAFVDIYRILSLFNVNDPCLQHAAKKLLVAGGRGAGKDISKDVQEVIDSCVRWQEMRQEDAHVDYENNTVHANDPSLMRLYGVRIIDWPVVLTLYNQLGSYNPATSTDFLWACAQLAAAFLNKTDSKCAPPGLAACTNTDWHCFMASFWKQVEESNAPIDSAMFRQGFQKTTNWHYGASA